MDCTAPREEKSCHMLIYLIITMMIITVMIFLGEDDDVMTTRSLEDG
jgi:hypothetical protein